MINEEKERAYSVLFNKIVVLMFAFLGMYIVYADSSLAPIWVSTSLISLVWASIIFDITISIRRRMNKNK